MPKLSSCSGFTYLLFAQVLINQLPYVVMSTASTSTNDNASMDFGWEGPDKTTRYNVYLHFAELQVLKANQPRSFNIFLNGKHCFGQFSPEYLSTTTVSVHVSSSILNGLNYTFSLSKPRTQLSYPS